MNYLFKNYLRTIFANNILNSVQCNAIANYETKVQMEITTFVYLTIVKLAAFNIFKLDVLKILKRWASVSSFCAFSVYII